MKFWDSSAVVPLLVQEPSTAPAQALFEEDPAMLVWWATEVECISAVARLEREEQLDPTSTAEALARLDALAGGWNEVQPVERIRRLARRLLRVHNLRAADSLQLAAALLGCEDNPATLELVCLDDRLIAAAEREGFPIVDPRARPEGRL